MEIYISKVVIKKGCSGVACSVHTCCIAERDRSFENWWKADTRMNLICGIREVFFMA
jgi:hypothetical protein